MNEKGGNNGEGRRGNKRSEVHVYQSLTVPLCEVREGTKNHMRSIEHTPQRALEEAEGANLSPPSPSPQKEKKRNGEERKGMKAACDEQKEEKACGEYAVNVAITSIDLFVICMICCPLCECVCVCVRRSMQASSRYLIFCQLR